MTSDVPVHTHASDLPAPARSPWENEAVVNRLKILWTDHSATEITRALWDEFQLSVTRNSVVGKLHRMKLTVDDKSSVHPLTRHDPAQRRPRNSIPKRTAFEPGPLSTFVDVVLDPLNLSFADIRHDQCKSITNDDLSAPLYCGHWVSPGFHYCASHRSIYYRDGKREGVRQSGKAMGVPA